MPPQAPDQAGIAKLANELLAEHGEGAAGYVCDRILEHMGGDPAVEDMWHAVLDLIYEFEESCAASPSAVEHRSRENPLH